MVWQKEITIQAPHRGFHIITQNIINQTEQLPQTGLMHVMIKHTSAALTINENADPTVRVDFESYFNRTIKENESYYEHTLEGSDDMPAHLKSSIIGCEITIPITNHRLNLGTWQGIYLCEFKNYPTPRKLVLTILS